MAKTIHTILYDDVLDGSKIIMMDNCVCQLSVIRLNGTEYKAKGMMGYAIVKEYLKAHPNTTIEELKDTCHNALLGRWGAWNFIEDDIEAARKLKEETSMYRHLLKEEFILTSGDGVKFVVSNQWEKANVLNLLQIAKNEGWQYEIVRQ